MTQPPDSTTRSTGAVVAAVLVGVWIVTVTLGAQWLGWALDQALVMYTGERPGWLWPVAATVTGIGTGVPALLLALVPTAAVVRAIGRAWLGATGALMLLGAIRVVPDREPELYLALLTVAATGFAALWRPPRPRYRSGVPPLLAGTVVGLLLLAPWLLVGALGSAWETGLAVTAAVGLGWLVARLGATALAGLPPQTGRLRTGRPGRWLLRAVVLAVTWTPVAAGAGPSGAQLALMVVLPVLGLAAAAVWAERPATEWSFPPVAPVAVMVAVAALGPLALIDGEEISLFLTVGRDVPFWALVATVGAAVLGLLAGLGCALRPPGRPLPVAGLAVGLVALLTTGYVVVGQPGWHGERWLVVLADQADLTAAPTGTGPAARDARATWVYRRLVAHARTTQEPLRAELDRRGLTYTPYYLVNAVVVDGGPTLRTWLAGRDDVARVLRIQRLRPLPLPPTPVPAAPAPPDQAWSIAAIGADRVWRELGVTGEGIVVGGPDSGVDGAHPALAPGFRGGDDSWLDPWYGTTAPTDPNGHGTHTLGTAVGRGGIGVAPDAQWTACANLPRGLGNPAVYLDCLQFMLAPYPAGGDPWTDGDPTRAPHVLTNSWACPPLEGCDATVLRPAVAALAAAGIYQVVAAGNTGPFCGSVQDPPATYPEVLTVGAVDRQERPAFFSSRGPVSGVDKPDLVAPGVGVVSALPGGGYGRLSGTSMATPHVAGVVALMWSANPDLIGDLAATTSILTTTARPITVTDTSCGAPAVVVGAGLVDAYAAVRAAQAVD